MNNVCVMCGKKISSGYSDFCKKCYMQKFREETRMYIKKWNKEKEVINSGVN